jgi:hypothetical protein
VPVVEVRCRVLRAPLHTPFVTALRSTTVVESLLVEVLDEDGAHGIGEAPVVEQVTGQSLDALRGCVGARSGQWWSDATPTTSSLSCTTWDTRPAARPRDAPSTWLCTTWLPAGVD